MRFAVFKVCFNLMLIFSGVKLQGAANAVTDEIIPSTVEAIQQTTQERDVTENSLQVIRNGKCVCAVFDGEKLSKTAEPIFAHPTVNVQCDEAGEQQCKNICIVLANGARGIGASILCSILGHADRIKVSLFSNTCDAPDYSHTGVIDTNPICCHDGIVTNCRDLKKEHLQWYPRHIC